MAENLLMASEAGSPAMLVESVSKYTAKDCKFANYQIKDISNLSISVRQRTNFVDSSSCAFYKCGFPILVHGGGSKSCKSYSRRKRVLDMEKHQLKPSSTNVT